MTGTIYYFLIMTFLRVVLLLVCVSVASVVALDNGAALTPPMEFSTWNKLRCHFDDKVLLEATDIMVKSGMMTAGYKSLRIDDYWSSRQWNIITD